MRGRLALVAIAIACCAAAFFHARARRPAPPATKANVTPASACASNRACNAAGAPPAICRKSDGACVPLASPECSVRATRAALERDDTVWIGTLFSTSGDDAAVGRINVRAVELALGDFDAVAAPTGARLFGLVECNDSVGAERALAHLVDDVHVPAIVGFKSGTEVIELSGTLLAHDTLAMVTLSTNPLVTRIPQPNGGARLVWRTTYSETEAAAAIAAFIPEVLEKTLPARPTKVALVTNKGRNLSPMSQTVFESLRFNGASALANGRNYRELVFNTQSRDRLDADYAQIARELVDFAPHVVVYVGEPSIAGGVVAPVESRWRERAYRPRWINLSTIPPEVLKLVGTDAALRRRFFGVTTSSATPPNARFVLHYNEAFTDTITRTQSPNSSYDAFYLLAFATYAIGDEPVTGPSLARAFARLVPPGRPTDIGVAGIYDAIGELRRGRNVDVNGATGALDFDLATGESTFDQEILCVGVDDRGTANDAIESGLTFRASDRTLVGTMRCP